MIERDDDYNVFEERQIDLDNELEFLLNMPNDVPLSISDWVEECYNSSYAAGWWDEECNQDHQIGTKLALIHSEISEALEGVRKNLMDEHLPHRPMPEVELADACIRIFDLAGRLKYDLEGAIIEKLAYNAERQDHKLENRMKDGGKKF